ncbi:MAG: hypothetical protein Q8Q95_02955 [bacterium]|nr:hypothetical protein [bacterium]
MENKKKPFEVLRKNEQVQLLKRDLIKMPEHDGEYIHEYTTPENLIITVTTKTKNRRNYIFGGPIWCAIVNFSDEKKLKVNFLSPLKKSYIVEWVKVNEITLHFNTK